MGLDFWLKRWNSKDTPWHQSEVEAFLVKYLPKRAIETALVPLCGKSVDLLWLSERAKRVVGIEASPLACEEFFGAHAHSFERRMLGEFEIFTAKNIELWCGDIFKLTPKDLGAVDFIYDRAALIALPPELRVRYADLLKRIALNSKEKSEILLITREVNHPTEGPPFLVSEEEVRSLYSPALRVTTLEAAFRPSRANSNDRVKETAFTLTP